MLVFEEKQMIPKNVRNAQTTISSKFNICALYVPTYNSNTSWTHFRSQTWTRPCAGLTWYPMQPTKFVEKDIHITHTKANKKGFMVALACHGKGGKLPALIIFKETSGQLGPWIKKNLVIPANIHVQASTNGWMTTQLYLWWLKNICGPAEAEPTATTTIVGSWSLISHDGWQ